MTKTDPRDAIIQEHAPTIMVPNFRPLPQMADYGHRYLAAADGLWLDVTHRLGQFRVQIAAAELPLPYGKVETLIVPHFERLTVYRHLFDRFVDEARAALPNEHAAWLVWNHFDQIMDYWPLEILEASPGRIQYTRPQLTDNEVLAIDLHSHGAGEPFFSGTDDEDDAGETKVAIVVGGLGGPKPHFVGRLCIMGHHLPMVVPIEVAA